MSLVPCHLVPTFMYLNTQPKDSLSIFIPCYMIRTSQPITNVYPLLFSFQGLLCSDLRLLYSSLTTCSPLLLKFCNTKGLLSENIFNLRKISNSSKNIQSHCLLLLFLSNKNRKMDKCVLLLMYVDE